MRSFSENEVFAIKEKLKNDFTYWYHRIDLGHGIVTPGFHYEPLWDNIRKCRSTINYNGKYVLDIASYDGLWAFEAEKLGADIVVATDCLYRTHRNFQFCRDVLGSKCLSYYNISPYNLFDRLDVFFKENYDNERPYDRLFDIVQHLGLLYHLRDPMLSLSQARSCIKIGGTLLLETNFVMDSEESFMLYNGIPFTARVSDNETVWWIPTKNCLIEMLYSAFFEPDFSSISVVEFTNPLTSVRERFPKKLHFGQIDKKYRIGRIAIKAIATDPNVSNAAYTREMLRTFRNPGFNNVSF
jgi:SAM-dependent methyltransferase